VIPLDATAASGSSSTSAAATGIGASVALGTSGASSKTSFQFASLDDRGLVNFWVAVEIIGADWYAPARSLSVLFRLAFDLLASRRVSEVDFGLGIGARLKLIKTASCHVYQEQSVVDAAVASAARATLLDPGNFGATIRGVHFCPADLNKYVKRFPRLAHVAC
jgi:hypothetical protein